MLMIVVTDSGFLLGILVEQNQSLQHHCHSFFVEIRKVEGKGLFLWMGHHFVYLINIFICSKQQLGSIDKLQVTSPLFYSEKLSYGIAKMYIILLDGDYSKVCCYFVFYNLLNFFQEMAQRNQFNIGETNKTSVRVHHGPGGQSNWSLGWGETNQTQNDQKANYMKYHNESKIVLGEASKQDQAERLRLQQQEKRKKEEELNNKLPTYDPKNGTKTNLFFGNEKTDYRKKDEVFTSVRVKAPPGGKSSIQFG